MQARDDNTLTAKAEFSKVTAINLLMLQKCIILKQKTLK